MNFKKYNLLTLNNLYLILLVLLSTTIINTSRSDENSEAMNLLLGLQNQINNGQSKTLPTSTNTTNSNPIKTNSLGSQATINAFSNLIKEASDAKNESSEQVITLPTSTGTVDEYDTSIVIGPRENMIKYLKEHRPDLLRPLNKIKQSSNNASENSLNSIDEVNFERDIASNPSMLSDSKNSSIGHNADKNSVEMLDIKEQRYWDEYYTREKIKVNKHRK